MASSVIINMKPWFFQLDGIIPSLFNNLTTEKQDRSFDVIMHLKKILPG